MSTIAKRLKLLRERKDLKQKDVALLTGLVRATLANWETGRTEPDLESVKLLADFYMVSTDYLLGRTDDPTPPRETEENPSPDFAPSFQEKNLGDAIIRIVNICAEFGLPKDIMFKMIGKAVEKFGPPGGNSAGGGAGSVWEGGIAAHGPDYPVSGIFNDGGEEE